jgi:two-component system nitrate/nitrite response regulator NarL
LAALDEVAPQSSLLTDSPGRHTQGMETTVLVLEDDPFTRMTLCGTLAQAGVRVVAQCETAAQAIDAQRQVSPAVALLDLDLGRGPTGLDVARTLRRNNPTIGIVFLTSFSDPRLVASPGQEPPAGSQYLVKKAVISVGIILRAIEKSVSSRAINKLAPAVSSDFGRLTSSQIATLRLVSEGLSNQEIARRESITEKSVVQQVGRIAKRLGITQHIDRNVRVSIASAYFHEAGTPSERPN